MRETSDPVRAAFRRAMTEGEIAGALAGARRIVVGYSGGADSSALLALTAEFCRGRAWEVSAIHIHHGIRGEEADRDAAACRAFCEARAIPLTVRYLDVPASAAREKRGVEETARRLRLAAFEEAAGEDGVVAVAHSADDNLETVVQRLARGTGLRGLGGIPPVRGRLIRPLLSVSAAQIRAFCRAEGIPFVEDSTNADTAYTRNYIRAHVLPALRAITPAPEASAARMCAALRADEAYLRQQTERALGEWSGGTSAPTALLRELPQPLLFRACAMLYANARGDGTDLGAVHLYDTAQLVVRGTAASLDLPGAVTARVWDGTLSFSREERRAAPPADFRFPLGIGTFSFPEYGFSLCVSPESEQKRTDEKNIYKLSICTTLSFDTIQGSFFLRFRREGDTVRFGGMTREVRKLLWAQKIPAARRPFVPLFCDGAGIVWVPGCPVRDGCADGGNRIRLEVAYHNG